MMDERLFRLIEMLSGKYNDDTPFGSQTASWEGYRIAEKINDLSIVPELLSFINSKEDRDLHKYAGTIIGYILCNTSDKTLADQLIQVAPSLDEDSDTLYELLTALWESGIPLDTDAKSIIYYITDERELIRNAAIRVLGNFISDRQAITVSLKEVLKYFYDHHDLGSAVRSLVKLKARDVIPELEEAYNKIHHEETEYLIKMAIKELKPLS